MGKQSKKSKNKRVTLKHKSKVLKKVKLHHKKKAAEAKKSGVNKKQPRVNIHEEWPVDEQQELNTNAARRAKAAEESEQNKTASVERVNKRKLAELDDDEDMADLSKKVFASEKRFEEGNVKDDFEVMTKIRDNSERSFYKELAKVIEASDVILEVLDARDPIGTRCGDMEKMVMRAGPEKHLVLLLNKIDLVPREAAEKWLKYLREELPAVAFKCSTQEQRSNLGWKSSKAAKKTSNLLQTSDCLGAETLIKLLKNYSRSHEIKKSITVGVVGLPNVGKSSLINSLKRSHVANVGATPGLTRTMQEVQLDKNVKLLDCPGVVMLRSGESDAAVALRNCKRIEKLEDPVGPVKEILKLCPAEMLMTLYKLDSFDAVDDFLFKVATIRGKLKKGGIVDINAAARIVLHDWNEGKIPYYTMPPVRNDGEAMEATIVSELGKEFNVDEVYGTDSSIIGSLKSVDDFNSVNVMTGAPVAFDETMLETDKQPEHEIPVQSINKGEDESMVETDSVAEATVKNPTIRQNEKLYTAEGVLNTRLRKAEKKRRKKANKIASMEEDSSMDGDYNVKVDNNVKNDIAMDVGEGEDDDGSAKAVMNNRFALPEDAEELVQ
ncbi:GTP-binding family protein [Artemisia annua]|uniref:GTP-binding family protein n=2 Tax=Anthemideae TaxID=102810 RepID=A0A2U1PBG6_ARTAN|nr:GTP-binding family protein [Artemisia annua]